MNQAPCDWKNMKNSEGLKSKHDHEITQEVLEHESFTSDANKIPLRLEVDTFYSWLARESNQLSQIGNEIHHNDPLLRISRNKARSVLEVLKADVGKRKPFVAELLVLARTFLRESNENDSLTYNTNYRKEPRHTEGKKQILFFSNEQFELIEKLWRFLQVQIKILDIQLRCQKVNEKYSEERKICDNVKNNLTTIESFLSNFRFQKLTYRTSDDSVEECKNFQSQRDNITNQDASLTSDERQRLLDLEHSKKFETIRKDSRFFSEDKPSTATQTIKTTKHVAMNVQKSTSDMIELNDDGYHSKMGESASEELLSIPDMLSINCGPLLQNASKTHVRQQGVESLDSVSCVSNGENDQSFVDLNKHDASSASTVTLCSDEWDEISKVVEKFSQNTVTLQSWIEELGDVSQQESSSKFCGSQCERIATVKKHVERLYGDVMEDAAVLLKNLFCERSTILAVLQKVDAQCLKYGISVGDDYSDLCNIMPIKMKENHMFLSPKLKNNLTSSLSFCEEFKPLLTSTPRETYETKKLTNVEGRPFSRAIEAEDKRARFNTRTAFSNTGTQSFLSAKTYETKSSSCGSSSWSIASQRYWTDFKKESKSVLEWLQNMERNILRVETGSFSAHKVETLFVGCLHQLNKNKTRRECLNIKSNYVGTMFPELQHHVQSRLTEVDELWRRLKLKLCHYLTSLSLKDKSVNSQNGELSLSSRRFDLQSSTVEKWKKSQSFSTADLPLRDCSFSQTRNRLDRNACMSRDKGRSLRKERNSPRGVIPKLELPQEDSEYSDVSSYRTSVESSWIEFEGIEDELKCHYRLQEMRSNISHLPCKPYRHAKRTSAEVWPTRTKNFFSKTKVDGFDQSQNAPDSSFIPNALYLPHDKKVDIKRTSEKLHNKDALTFASAESESTLLFSNAHFLAGRITEFHLWLKQMEDQTYRHETETLGWNPNHLGNLHSNNQDRMHVLEQRRKSLTRLLSSSEVMLHQSKQEISEFLLLWSSWMLEQRYHNLILYSVDIECILERRLEVLEKGTDSLSHPTDGVWTDRGVDMAPHVTTTDEDYTLFFDV